MDDFDFVPGINPFTSTAAPKLDIPDEPVNKPAKPQNTGVRPSAKPGVSNFTKLVAALTFCVSIAVMLSAIIWVDGKIVANNKTINELQEEVDQYESESVRLSSEIGSKMSADNIRNYAVSVLGMQKAERYQIHYFDSDEGDQVIVANGKAVNADKQSN